MTRLFVSSWVAILVLSCSSQLAEAVEPNGTALSLAERKLAAALESEASGKFELRSQLLSEAQGIAADLAPVRWHQGMIGNKKTGWLTIDDSILSFDEIENLKRYESRRSKIADDVASHLELADWCGKVKLFQQQRSHWNRVIQLQPDHLAARHALGYRRVGLNWIAPEQIASLARRLELVRTSMNLFGKQATDIANGLESRNKKQVETAKEQLEKLSDPRSVPAIEMAIVNRSPQVLQETMNWLEGIPSQEAALVLVRIALFHSAESTKRMATEHLSDRSFAEYVPTLVEMAQNPVSSTLVPVFRPNGGLAGFRQAFAREGKNQNEVFVVDTEVAASLSQRTIRIPRDTDPANPDLQRNLENVAEQVEIENELARMNAFAQAEFNVSQRQQSILADNQRAAMLNAAISKLLSDVSGENVVADANSIWSWWDQYNDVESSGSKPVVYGRSYNRIQQTVSQVGTRRRSECFVKDTPVLTHRGQVSIDKISIGDMVLTKEIDSGALLWKPVIEITQRRSSPLFQIQAANETLSCTPGHRFWVTGKGWTKARDLVPGNVLHGAKQPSLVQYVREKGEAETFNLVVADNANYFVGKALILSHDFTAVEPTYTPVPGMLASLK